MQHKNILFNTDASLNTSFLFLDYAMFLFVKPQNRGEPVYVACWPSAVRITSCRAVCVVCPLSWLQKYVGYWGYSIIRHRLLIV